ncbi:PQQ-dependent sugar dehydrogenase [Cellulomonas bogoriensis]|uniref:Glucose sorbosone dehydrogenase n=1 Tax=Cellulomonas bogoriensis 69B4 = DSM 16987 TaxID=1386082 RepID=A0A0A0C196_9CELL|nr:PQQ-dependent sugar dehydrogenase [Cellulomonas bogoriensis]KGM13965.1 glucose sorbosone dehydrogenase [Cellulomonas bogoriensis 69B4 = DSM 16987]
MPPHLPPHLPAHPSAGRLARLATISTVALLAPVLVVACGPEPEATPTVVEPTDEVQPTDRPADPDPAGEDFPSGPRLAPAGSDPEDVVTGLSVPWGMAFLPGGAVLLTQRDTAEVLLLTAEGLQVLQGPGADELREGTDPTGEGGLLGVTVSPDVADDRWVYLYRTTPAGNEVVRTRLGADLTLGGLEVVVDGIAAAATHNGGRIAFGPDGHLYVGTGDAAQPGLAQQEEPAGAILRVTADGEPAPGNPEDGSPVWSTGHRNVQGLAWLPDGRMVASEFGQAAYDELNVIEPGGNYGWPDVEGMGGEDAGFVDPVLVWAPADASPSGIAVLDGVVHVASLRGQRLWAVRVEQDGTATDQDHLVGELGRLRDVVAGPDGALWVLTGNTDGRGSPAEGDDRLVRLQPPPPPQD